MTADIGTLTAAGNPTPPESSSGAADDLMSDGSLWFVGFPQASTADHVEALGECMQKVDDYHTWVSSRCGGKPGAIAEDMRTTPWLGTQSDQQVSREIECNINDFHSELIKAILMGFVDVAPGFLRVLEGILQSLRSISQQSTGKGSRSSTLIGHRYDYVPRMRKIRSSMRVVSFNINDSISKIDVAKKTETRIKCTIEYSEYSALFNEKLWDKAWEIVEADVLESMRAKVKGRTVTMPTPKTGL